MSEEEFWAIVDSIGWPETHHDVAKRRFMETYPKETAVAFAGLFRRFKKELYARAGLTAVSDSCGDTLEHIVGLCRAEHLRNMDAPHLVREREDRMDYRESFAYSIPFEDEYALLSDEGYESFIRNATDLINELDATDPDDVHPRSCAGTRRSERSASYSERGAGAKQLPPIIAPSDPATQTPDRTWDTRSGTS